MAEPRKGFFFRQFKWQIIAIMGLLVTGCADQLQRVPVYYAPSVKRSVQDQGHTVATKGSQSGSPAASQSSVRGQDENTPVKAVSPGEKAGKDSDAKASLRGNVPQAQKGEQALREGQSLAEERMRQEEIKRGEERALREEQKRKVEEELRAEQIRREEETRQEGLLRTQEMVPEEKQVQKEEKDRGDSQLQDQKTGREDAPGPKGVASSWYDNVSNRLARIFEGGPPSVSLAREANASDVESTGRAVVDNSGDPLPSGGDGGGIIFRQPVAETEIVRSNPAESDVKNQRERETSSQDLVVAVADERKPPGEGDGDAGGFFNSIFSSHQKKKPDQGESGAAREGQFGGGQPAVDHSLPVAEPEPHGEAPWQVGSSADAGKGYFVHVDGLKESSDADKMVKRLKELNVPFLQQQARVDGVLVHRVYVGPLADRDAAQTMANDLEKRKIQVGPITNRLD